MCQEKVVYVECEYCAVPVEPSDVHESTHGEDLCPSCYEDNHYTCDKCIDSVHSDDVHVLDNSGEILCEDCYTYHTTVCDHCNERVSDDNIMSDGNLDLCESCRDDYYTCESCEDFVHREDVIERHGDFYCEACAPNEAINEYSYSPNPTFYGYTRNYRYYGVELEVESDGYADNGEVASEIQQVTDAVYMKEDGSLDDGFEIVSHPATLDYHLSSLGWNRIFDILQDNDYTSHDAGTCGLHVHVSRLAFGTDYNVQETSITKALYIIERFWKQFRNFARRTEEQLNEWARSYAYDYEEEERDNVCPTILKLRADNSGRYHAVNLSNSQTVEFRLFRGTLRRETFKATLQMVEYIVHISTHHTIDELQQMTWRDFVQTINYEELNNYLVRRGLK